MTQLLLSSALVEQQLCRRFSRVMPSPNLAVPGSVTSFNRSRI